LKIEKLSSLSAIETPHRLFALIFGRRCQLTLSRKTFETGARQVSYYDLLSDLLGQLDP